MVYDIGGILAQWESAGVFEFVFPLLLIFALVFGILQKTKIFGEDGKNINLVVAFVIGFMAIRLEFVRVVFSEIAARGAVGVFILIMMLILISMFIMKDPDSEKGWYIGFSVIAAIIFIVIIIQSFNFYGFSFSNYIGGDLIGWVVGAVLVIGVIVALSLGGEKAPKAPKEK